MTAAPPSTSAGRDGTCAALSPVFTTGSSLPGSNADKLQFITSAYGAARATAPDDLGQGLDEYLRLLDARQHGTVDAGAVANTTIGTGGAISVWYHANCDGPIATPGDGHAFPRRFIDPLPADLEVVARERGCEGGSQTWCLDEAVVHKPGVSAPALRDQLVAEYQHRGTLHLGPGQTAQTDGGFSFSINNEDGPAVSDLEALSRLRADQWAGTVTIESRAPGL